MRYKHPQHPLHTLQWGYTPTMFHLKSHNYEKECNIIYFYACNSIGSSNNSSIYLQHSFHRSLNRGCIVDASSIHSRDKERQISLSFKSTNKSLLFI